MADFGENGLSDAGDTSRVTITFDQPLHSFSLDVSSLGVGTEFIENFSITPTSAGALNFDGSSITGSGSTVTGTILSLIHI